MNASGYERVAPLFLAQLDAIFGEPEPEITEAAQEQTQSQPQKQEQPQKKFNPIPAICIGIMAVAVGAVAAVLLGGKKKNNGESRT